MRHTAHPPACPMCGTLVIRTHHCRARPVTPPHLVPMPTGFRERVMHALAKVPETTWTTEPLPLDDEEHGS